MADIAERNMQKVELASLGYSLKYIDEWQPKTTLYRHKPSYNEEGTIVPDIGTTTPNVPGSPDYVLKKSRIGLFQWPPSETCSCKWCVNRKEATEITVTSEVVEESSKTTSRKGKVMGPHFKAS